MSGRLESDIAELASRIDHAFAAQPSGDRATVVDQVLTALDRRPSPSPHRWRFTAAAAVALAVVLAVPSSRQAIGRWLGFDAVRIERGPLLTAPTSPALTAPTVTVPTSPALTVPTSPAPTHLGRALGFDAPLSATEARQRTGLPVPALSGYPGGQIFVVRPPAPNGQVVVLYPPSSMAPEGTVPGVGVLLAALPGHLDRGVFVKVVGNDSPIEEVGLRLADGRTVDAVWLAGSPHQLGWETGGMIDIETLRLAGPTLLWEIDGVVYRLEAAVDRPSALALAATVTT